MKNSPFGWVSPTAQDASIGHGVMKTGRSSRLRGFTLVELLVVKPEASHIDITLTGR